jgi:hypothetical protein
MVNPKKLHKEIVDSGINISGCNESGKVWDLENKEIQNRSDVMAILAKHDPTPEKEVKEPTIKELLQRIEAIEKKVK